MRRFLLYGSVGFLSLGWLTGCSPFRSSDTSAVKSNTPYQPFPLPAAAKTADKVAAPVRVDAKPVAAPALPALPPPPMPAPLPLPAPPIPRLPAANEVPRLPPPPSSQTSANDGPLPADKIVVVSNLQPSSAGPDIRDLIDVTERRTDIVPAARSTDGSPGATQGKTVGASDGPIAVGNTEHFTIITGQVQEFRKKIRLRYAAIDQNDLYGGVVTLEGSVDLSQLRDGKHVRVRGVLIPPLERNQIARFRVTAVELLD